MNARLPLLVLLALGVAACGRKVTRDAPAAQDPAYGFPHATHVDSDVACVNCHPMDQATRLEQGVRHVRLPANPSKVEACADCHDTDPELKPPARARPFRLSFSHADHLPRVNGECGRCHQSLTEPGDAAPKVPPMGTCTSCHTHQQDFAQAKCMPCHLELRGYKPETAFKHEGDWLRSHGSQARPSGETCAACHDQTYCAECHSPQTAAGRPSIIFPERVDRTFIHRGDYVSRHMVEAGANPASCRRCHGSAFCQACHEVQGLGAAIGESLQRPQSHQQPGWATGGGGGARPLHARAARRDISSCGACHDGGGSATCVACHRVGGVASQAPGASPNGPHPASFVRKHRGDDKSDGSCAACHLSPAR